LFAPRQTSNPSLTWQKVEIFKINGGDDDEDDDDDDDDDDGGDDDDNGDDSLSSPHSPHILLMPILVCPPSTIITVHIPSPDSYHVSYPPYILPIFLCIPSHAIY
jgi:hypothetical protein